MYEFASQLFNLISAFFGLIIVLLFVQYLHITCLLTAAVAIA